MRLRLCRLAAALALFGTPVVAVAQVIPPRDLPGRERERFIEQQAPRAQPRGTAISLPSTVAPPGAESIRLVVSAVRITGSSSGAGSRCTPCRRRAG